MRAAKGIRAVAATAVVAGLIVVGAAAPSAATPARAKAISGTFVGAAKGSRTYVAVYVDTPDKKGGRKVVAYACDGQQVAEWFEKQHVTGNTLSLTGHGGAQLKATLTTAAVKGTIAHAHGTNLSFVAKRAEPPAGLYRAAQTIAGHRYLGGWILLTDGTQRGILKRAGIPIGGTDFSSNATGIGFLDPANPTVMIAGVGTLDAERVG